MRKITILTAMSSLKLDKKKLILVGVVSALVIFIDVGLLLRLQLSGIKSTSAKIAKASKDLEVAKREVSKTKRGGQPSLKMKRLLSEGQIEDLMEEIDTLAKENKINIIQAKRSQDVLIAKDSKSIKGKAASKDKNPSLLITLDVAGDYHNLGIFLNEIEGGESLVSVEELALIPESDTSIVQRAHVVLKTYVK